MSLRWHLGDNLLRGLSVEGGAAAHLLISGVEPLRPQFHRLLHFILLWQPVGPPRWRQRFAFRPPSRDGPSFRYAARPAYSRNDLLKSNEGPITTARASLGELLQQIVAGLNCYSSRVLAARLFQSIRVRLQLCVSASAMVSARSQALRSMYVLMYPATRSRKILGAITSSSQQRCPYRRVDRLYRPVGRQTKAPGGRRPPSLPAPRAAPRRNHRADPKTG
jgi:hypothetical protein